MVTVDFEKAFPKLTRRLGKQGVGVLSTIMHEMDASDGDALIEQDSSADSLFLVIEGGFRHEITRPDGTIEVEQIGPAQWVGAAELFGYEPKSISRVVATAASHVLQLQHADFWSTLKEHPEFASGLTRDLVDQMSDSTRNIDNMIMGMLEKQVTH